MPLRRYRVAAEYNVGRYVVLDHGEPDGQVPVGPGQALAGETVPRYLSSDPYDPASDSLIVFRTPDMSAESKAKAAAKANELNAAWEADDESPHDQVLSDLDLQTAGE
jgi:hypothetical protein